MSANSLLLWMSARREGSWQQFRVAVEELHLGDNDGEQDETEEDSTTDQYALPLYQALRLNLQRLGHAEFFAGARGSDWRVTPPSLAVTQHARGWLGILAGARSDKLLRRLHEAPVTEELETLPFPSCPDQIRIVARDAHSLAALAERVGLVLQHDAPAAILTTLPPIDDSAVRRQTPLPFGTDWRIEHFSTSDLGWKAATREEALSPSGGLFRFSLRHQRQVLLCSKGNAFQVPGQVGKYLVLRRCRRRVLRYDAINRRLTVPSSCRPPFLVERALILCSGSPPSYEAGVAQTGILHYAEIPQAIAGLASALLRQELR
ncbi:MAG: hypothetical protein HYY16_03610 [Planctomycetes bacterium]|nr:hypothetical protein [Planctomycetota bacterium]